MGSRRVPHGDGARSPEATRMIPSTRTDLTVPYARKEEAKALGARWDGDKRTWYAPPGTDLGHFDQRWLPKGCEPDPDSRLAPISQESDAGPQKGVSLTDLLT